MDTQTEEDPGLQVEPSGDLGTEHTSTDTSRPPSLVLDGPPGDLPDASASPGPTSPARPDTIDPPLPPNAFVKTLLELGHLVVLPDPKGVWRYTLAPRRWGKDGLRDMEHLKLLVKTAQAWVQDPSQALQAIDFLEQVIDCFSADEALDTLNQFASALLQHCPPPCEPGCIPRIRCAVRHAVTRVPPEGLTQGLSDLGAAYAPWLALQEELRQLTQRVGKLVPNDPLSVDLALRVQTLQHKALEQQLWGLAVDTLALAQRLGRIGTEEAYRSTLQEVLQTIERRGTAVQMGLFPSPQHRALFCGDPPRAWRSGSGAWTVHQFAVPVAQLRELISQVCLADWAAGEYQLALSLLNDALGASDAQNLRTRLTHKDAKELAEVARLRHELLLVLARQPGFFDQVLFHLDRRCIVEAAAELLQGWWLSEPEHVFEPSVRERLIDLIATDDWERCLTLFEGELKHCLSEAAREHWTPELAEHLLRRLRHVQQRAAQLGDVEWLQRCLQWAQRLLAQLGDSTDPKCVKLKKRCQGFIESIPAEHYLATMGDWIKVEQQLGQDQQMHTTLQVQRSSPALQTQEGRTQARARFANYVDLLLESPDGPDWTYTLELTQEVAATLERPFDQRQQLGWCLREAGRGHTQPLEDLVNELIKEQGPKEARAMLFNALCQASDRGMPWATLEKAINTVHMSCKPSDRQQLKLRLMQARRGHTEPLLEWLQGDLPAGELNRALINQLLALANESQLTLSARIRLLSAAKAQLTKFGLHAEDLDAALQRLREERQQRRQRKAATRARSGTASPRGQAQRAQPSPRKPPMPRAQQALAQWADVDLSQPMVIKVSAPPDKAPKTAEQRRSAQAALLAWLASMQAEAQPRPWSQLLGAVEGIEIDWGWKFSRQRLLALCLGQVAQDNSIQPLLDHLPLLADTHPRLDQQAQLLSLATRQNWDATQRAALIKRLIAWAPNSGVLNMLLIQAINALPKALHDEVAALLQQRHDDTLDAEQRRRLLEPEKQG